VHTQRVEVSFTGASLGGRPTVTGKGRGHGRRHDALARAPRHTELGSVGAVEHLATARGDGGADAPAASRAAQKPSVVLTRIWRRAPAP